MPGNHRESGGWAGMKEAKIQDPNSHYIQANVDALKRLQVETASELDAMLPSILDKAFKEDL